MKIIIEQSVNPLPTALQKIPAKTTHASESKARQEIDFVMLSMCHGITSKGTCIAAGQQDDLEGWSLHTDFPDLPFK